MNKEKGKNQKTNKLSKELKRIADELSTSCTLKNFELTTEWINKLIKASSLINSQKEQINKLEELLLDIISDYDEDHIHDSENCDEDDCTICRIDQLLAEGENT